MNLTLSSVLLCLGLCLAVQNQRPIVGVVLETTDPNYDTICGCKNSECQSAQSAYNLYIQQAGGSAVPIFVNQSADYYENLFSRINGVLLPGGGVNVVSSYYSKVARMAYEYARRQNDAGKYFTIWGTCLGMQEMTVFPLHPIRNLLSDCHGTEDVSLPLTFTSDATGSHMYKDLPMQLNITLSKYNVTPNFHHYCLAMDTFTKTKQLSDFYLVTSTSKDATGLQFVSSIEARDYPFYGVQWHPEKINFLAAHNDLNQTRGAVKISQYFANFLADEAMKNSNSFASFEEEGRFVFENFETTYHREEQIVYYCLRQSDVPHFDEN